MNIIYQYWDGELNDKVLLSSKLVKEYAKRIGADYLFEHNPNFLYKDFYAFIPYHANTYGSFKPIFDPYFEKYDKVLFLDADIFPVENLQESIFDCLNGEIGLVPSETVKDLPPHIIDVHKEWWYNTVLNEYGISVEEYCGAPINLNTGVVLYSKAVREKLRQHIKIDTIMRNAKLVIDSRSNTMFMNDESYLQITLYLLNIDVHKLPQKWNAHLTTNIYSVDGINASVNHIDRRTPDTNLIHVRLSGYNFITSEEVNRIISSKLPQWPERVLSGDYIKEYVEI